MLREKVLKVLQENPHGLRTRGFCSTLSCYDISAITYFLRGMEKKGLIKSTLVSDPANCEWYTLWQLA